MQLENKQRWHVCLFKWRSEHLNKSDKDYHVFMTEPWHVNMLFSWLLLTNWFFLLTNWTFWNCSMLTGTFWKNEISFILQNFAFYRYFWHKNPKYVFMHYNYKTGKYTAKLTFLGYDNFGENQTLCIGMAWLQFQKFQGKCTSQVGPLSINPRKKRELDFSHFKVSKNFFIKLCNWHD